MRNPLPVNSPTSIIVFSQISWVVHDVLPFYADEYTVYDFQTFSRAFQTNSRKSKRCVQK